ncbi:DUF7257 domain-containing protein [Nocardia testacea]|uniref:DUF7257 domain-containing protein n=1 Tax=Nocardia testacea TaxID=248551 RepID=UPI00031808A8|nr:hypothetical protein [Nocardia testacea]
MRLVKPPEVKFDFLAAIEQFVRSLFGLTSAHGTAIAELETRISTGASHADKFNRPNAAVLGEGWIQGGAGQGLGIIDYAARLDNSGIATGIRYAICPQTMPSNDHSVSAIVNPAGVMDGCPTTLFIRANSDLTQFVYAQIWKRSLRIGRGTRSGNSWSFSEWRPNTARGINESDTVEFVGEGNTYRLIVNRTTVLEHEDTSGYPVDAAHRTVGFSSETRFQGIIPNWSWGLAGFSARASLGTLAATASVAATAQTTAVAAQTTAESKPDYSDIPTNIPLWVNISPTDDPTCPLSTLVNWTAESGNELVETEDPGMIPSTRAIMLGFIRATRNRSYSTVGMITATGDWGLSPTAFMVGVYKMAPGTGNLTKLWDSGDVKSQISASGTQFRLSMPTISATQGDVFAVAVLQIAPTVGTAVRPLLCVRHAQPAQPAGIYPRSIFGYVNNADSLPATIAASSVLNDQDFLPWFVLG